MLSKKITIKNHPIKWPLQLYQRVAGKQRLAGIEVYYDFDWEGIIGHNRGEFKRGRRLALLVQSKCPEGKCPALLLTTSLTAQEGRVETDTHFVAVVKIDQYLSSANADPATTYFATRLGTDIISSLGAQLIEIQADQINAIDQYLDDNLDHDALSRWMSRNINNLRILKSLAKDNVEGNHLHAAVDPHMVVNVLRQLSNLDSEVVDAIVEALSYLNKAEDRRKILNVITSTVEGRIDAGASLGKRISDRIMDAKKAAEAFHRLLKNSSSIETDMQEFLEDHPWLIGLDYVEVRPKQSVPRGALDFILERYDGYHDLLELKSPQDPIIVERTAKNTQMPGSPSHYELSPELSKAFAQTHAYREILEGNDKLLEEQYGLQNVRHPKLVIVIGRDSLLTLPRKNIVRQLNLSMQRVEIVPYDVISKRAEMFMSQLEKYLDAERASMNS